MAPLILPVGCCSKIYEQTEVVYSCPDGAELREVQVFFEGNFQPHNATAVLAADHPDWVGGDGSDYVRSYYRDANGVAILEANRPSSVSRSPDCGIYRQPIVACWDNNGAEQSILQHVPYNQSGEPLSAADLAIVGQVYTDLDHNVLTGVNPADVKPGGCCVAASNASPVAVADTGQANAGDPITISVLGNDQEQDAPANPSTVRLLDSNASLVTSLAVPGEGLWTVNTGTGAITFTPEPGFAGDPTPVLYQFDDALGNTSNLASISPDYLQPPVATPDSALGSTGQPVTVNVLANDTDPEGDIDPSTVRILDGSGNPVTSLTVPGEGDWMVNTTTGEVIFTPEPGFSSDPTPINYQVSDFSGNASDPVEVSIDYPDPFGPIADIYQFDDTPGPNISTTVQLTNDVGCDGGVTSWEVIDGTQQNVVVTSPSSTPSFTISVGETSCDYSFRYRILCDGQATGVEGDVAGSLPNGTEIIDTTTNLIPDPNFTANPRTTRLVEQPAGPITDHWRSPQIGYAGFNLPDNSPSPNAFFDTNGGIFLNGTVQFGGAISQVPFPGDPAYNVPPTNSFYYFSGNDLGVPYTAAEIDFSGVTPGQRYRISFYVSNAVAPDRTNIPDNALLSVQIDGTTVPGGGPFEIYYHAQPESGHNGVDLWDRMEFIWTAPANSNGTHTLSLWDQQLGLAGDDVAVTAFAINPILVCGDVIANSDTVVAASVGSPETVQPLANDTSTDALDPASVVMYDAAGNEVLGNLVVPGEGTWTRNGSTGAITFSPQAGFTSDPAPIQYSVADINGVRSNRASIFIVYDITKASGKTFTNPEPLASQSTVLLTDNFNSGSLGAIWDTESGDDSVQLQVNDAGGGDFALEAFVPENGPFGVPGGNGRPRAEITHSIFRANMLNRTLWYTFQMYIVDDNLLDGLLAENQLIVHQIHGKSADEGGPLQWRSPKLSTRLGSQASAGGQFGNIYSLRTLNPDGSSANALRDVHWTTSRNPFVGKWTQFTYRIRLSPDANLGFIQLWVDGNKVYEEDNIQTIDQTQDRAFFKFGAYVQKQIRICFDDITIWEDLGPNRNNLI